MGEMELKKGVENGRIKVVTNSQFWWGVFVFIITTVFVTAVAYANFQQRLLNAEETIEKLDIRTEKTETYVRDIKVTRDRQWHEIQTNLKNICKAVGVNYERIED